MPEWKPEIRRRLASLQLAPPREAAIIEELSQYLEDCYAELLSSGATEAEAYRRTLAELSGSELLARELRRAERPGNPELIVPGTNRRTNMLAALWQDLRFGARMLLKQPGFTLIAVLTLALGIGANTAIFSIVNAVLLRPFPYKEPERLVILQERFNAGGRSSPSYPNLVDWRAQNTAFEAISAVRGNESFNFTGAGEPERLQGRLVSAEFFSLLGVEPLLGRGFRAEEDRPGATPAVILSYGFWQRRSGVIDRLRQCRQPPACPCVCAAKGDGGARSARRQPRHGHSSTVDRERPADRVGRGAGHPARVLGREFHRFPLACRRPAPAGSQG